MADRPLDPNMLKALDAVKQQGVVTNFDYTQKAWPKKDAPAVGQVLDQAATNRVDAARPVANALMDNPDIVKKGQAYLAAEANFSVLPKIDMPSRFDANATLNPQQQTYRDAENTRNKTRAGLNTAIEGELRKQHPEYNPEQLHNEAIATSTALIKGLKEETLQRIGSLQQVGGVQAQPTNSVAPTQGRGGPGL